MNDVLGESSMTTPLVIVGAGGHAREVLDVVKAMDAIAPTWSFLGFVAEKVPKFPRAMLRYMAEERVSKRDAHAGLFRGWIDCNEEEGVPTDLESLQTPTLVIQGAKDRVIDPSTGRALASRLPNARLEMLEGIGHVPQMEAPGAVAKMIDQFVREVEARRTDGRAAAAS